MKEGFVVDNSVVMSWCLRDDAGPFADAVLGRLEDCAALVPSVWPLELANTLLTAERRKLITESDAVRFISLLTKLPISIECDPQRNRMTELNSLGRKHGLSSYDASYLSLAMKTGLPLATLDEKLKRSARRAGVALLSQVT
jgi:predicted nucleic acid-binding protein